MTAPFFESRPQAAGPLPLDREALRERGGCAALGELLTRALGQQGLAGRLDRRLPAQVWNEAVGPEIARRAQPTVLSAGTLHVLVQDRNWRDQLDAMRGMLIPRLNQRLGRQLVRELKFGLAHAGALGGPAPGPAQEARAPAPIEAPEQLLQAAHKLPAGVREAVLRAAAAQRARAERP
jgi:Dna[CI] antecedent, DciA